jgi:hypothetical protein
MRAKASARRQKFFRAQRYVDYSGLADAVFRLGSSSRALRRPGVGVPRGHGVAIRGGERRALGERRAVRRSSQ